MKIWGYFGFFQISQCCVEVWMKKKNNLYTTIMLRALKYCLFNTISIIWHWNLLIEIVYHALRRARVKLSLRRGNSYIFRISSNIFILNASSKGICNGSTISIACNNQNSNCDIIARYLLTTHVTWSTMAQYTAFTGVSLCHMQKSFSFIREALSRRAHNASRIDEWATISFTFIYFFYRAIKIWMRAQLICVRTMRDRI